MIMIAGRRKVQRDGRTQIVYHTLGNLRLMNWVGIQVIFRPLFILLIILGTPHLFNRGSPRNDQPHRPNNGRKGIKVLHFLNLSKALQTFHYRDCDAAIIKETVLCCSLFSSFADDVQKLRIPG